MSSTAQHGRIRLNSRGATLSATMKTLSVFSCLLYILGTSLTDGAIIKVEGFQGRNVSFKCSHKLAWVYNKYICRDPCKGSEDRLVTVKSGGRAESGRITLADGGDGSFTVTFSQLQLSDSQKYWCGVDRPGLDTYTEVQLTVTKAVTNEVTTVMPDVCSTWTYQTTNSTELTTRTDNMTSTKLLTARNFTNEGQPNISTGAIVHATVVGVVVIFILILAVCFRKSIKNSRCKLQVNCNSTDPSNADKREVGCGDNGSNKGAERYQQVAETSSIPDHQQTQDPTTSKPTATKCIEPFHVYENISFSKLPEGSGYSPADVQNGHDDNTRIYINPLPCIIRESTGHVACRTNTSKPKTCTNTESCESSASPCVSRGLCESTEEKPRSLWFGLDVSGIN